MGLTITGRDYIASAVSGLPTPPTTFGVGTSYLGVGDSSTTFNNAQTDLVAATNKLRKICDGGFPTRAANVLTFKATFGSSEANFAWNEFGTFNASSAGTMLQRLATPLGTKASGQTWELTVTNTINAA